MTSSLLTIVLCYKNPLYVNTNSYIGNAKQIFLQHAWSIQQKPEVLYFNLWFDKQH